MNSTLSILTSGRWLRAAARRARAPHINPMTRNMKSNPLTRISRPVAVLLGAGSLFLGAGCQSTSTGNATAASPGNRATPAPATTNPTLVAKPRPVVVHDFKFDVAQLRTDPGLAPGRQGPAKRILGNLRPEETPVQKATRYATLLSETIAKELTALKIPATREAPGAPLPADGLVVGGEFLEVDEGNRLRRAIVGFGVGASDVLVQVSVYDLAQSRQQPILVYGTGTGSKPMPGGAVSMNPYAMAAKYVLARNASEKDMRRLGAQIAKDLAQVEAGGVPKH
jgi:hypothetical protein